jgi:serine/threonine protein kinase
LLYNAPETYETPDSYSNAIDIWSFGCVLFEMIKLERLFKNTNEIIQFNVNQDLNDENIEDFFVKILIKYNLYSYSDSLVPGTKQYQTVLFLKNYVVRTPVPNTVL